MRKFPVVLAGAAVCAVLFAGCGPTTFLIGKAGSYTNFGRDKPFFRKMLCERGELSRILANADLPQDLENDFYRYTCTKERSYDKVVSLYLFLTPAEKTRLKNAFKRQGYQVNSLPC
jgi:hypothetical protein